MTSVISISFVLLLSLLINIFFTSAADIPITNNNNNNQRPNIYYISQLRYPGAYRVRYGMAIYPDIAPSLDVHPIATHIIGHHNEFDVLPAEIMPSVEAQEYQDQLNCEDVVVELQEADSFIFAGLPRFPALAGQVEIISVRASRFEGESHNGASNLNNGPERASNLNNGPQPGRHRHRVGGFLT